MLNNNNTISKKCHYKHLTPSNKGQIQAYRNKGKSIRFIAKMLGKNPSTISRELKRNSVTQMDSSYAFKNLYIADTAHILYKKKEDRSVSTVSSMTLYSLLSWKRKYLKERKEFTALILSAMSTKETILIKLPLQPKLSMKWFTEAKLKE